MNTFIAIHHHREGTTPYVAKSEHNLASEMDVDDICEIFGITSYEDDRDEYITLHDITHDINNARIIDMVQWLQD